MSDFDPREFNQTIIDEFRASGGRVAQFGDAPLVILHTVGAKSGQPRETPLVTQIDGDRRVVFASAAGAPSHPAWFHNLTANPSIRVEDGTETYAATAVVLEGSERDDVYRRQVEAMPQFGEYEASAGDRVIPVVALVRA